MKSNNYYSLIIVIIAIYWGFYDMKPRIQHDTITSTKDFSIAKTFQHLKHISEKPHHVGTNAHKKVQIYLLNELEKLGLAPKIQKATVFNKKWKAGTTVENIVAKIKGKTDGKSLLLLSHYDSNPHASVGTSDAGSGIVTILEGVRAFLANKKQPKNDIIILFSDAEELGLLGAEAFVKHHPEAKNIGLVLNFEARGSGGPSYMFMETNGKNSRLLQEFIQANPKYPAANSLMYSVYKMLPNDTDLTVFREKANCNGFNFAFIGDHFDYHTAQDNLQRIDHSSLAHQKDYFVSCLNHFSEINLSQLNSNEDYVYVNFPIIGLLSFSFTWILPFLSAAIMLLLFIIFTGIKRKTLSKKDILHGAIPFILSIILVPTTNYYLWKIILWIHPAYQDILHGFTYNGYQYISAFFLFDIWLIFTVYEKFKKIHAKDIIVFPLIFWISINIIIFFYLKGAAFFLLPVYVGLIVLSILVFGRKKYKNSIFGILAIPILYSFAPLIKMLPVGLGLKNIFISGICIVLISGIITPVFHQKNSRNAWTLIAGIGALFFFFYASFNSGFSTENRKPNSLVYIQNIDDKTAFWATYNKSLDSYTQQIFNTEFLEGSIQNAETLNKYHRKFNYIKKAEYKDIKTTQITISGDTIVDNNREVWITLHPQRNITKYEIINNSPINLNLLTANGVVIQHNKTHLDKQTLLTYYFGNQDKSLTLKLSFHKNDKLHLTINEISHDLLTHSLFDLKEREEYMMPMPFVTNDAIISSRSFLLE